MPLDSRSRPVAYAFAIGVTAIAVISRWLLHPLMGETLPLVTLFGAVAAAVWVGGAGPATVAMAGGYVACAYLFIAPQPTLGLDRLQNVVGFLGYLATCSIIIGLGERMRREQRKAEEHEESLKVTFASVGDGVITTGKDGRVLMLNLVAEELTGWSQAEARGVPLESVFRIINEETRAPVDSPVANVLRTGAPATLAKHTLLVARDGTERPIDDTAAPITDRTGRLCGCVLVFRDVSGRRSVEVAGTATLNAARLLASIVESSGDAIISKSLDGTIQSWNAAAERLLGYTREQAVGRHISLIIPPDRLAEEDEIVRRIRAGDIVDHFETVRTRRDGQPIPLSLTISPVTDESGRVVGASKIARDITDRKASEEQAYGLLMELKEADRRKDEFLAMLAHELRGPLAPLRNLVEVSKRAAGPDHLLQSALDTMERQLGHLARLVDDLLDVSRITRNRIELRRETVELATIIQQSVDACRPLTDRAKQKLTVDVPSSICLHADSVRLVQVFSNILNNASKYTEPGGRIFVRADSNGDRVVVRIKDTGVGIPKDKLGSVFEMFSQVDRTLERAQGGLGIGLTLVKRLVEMHGGTVSAQSDGPGKGTELVVELPTVIAQSHEATAAPIDAASLSRRFLVVDDNVDSARSLAMLLTITGHEAQTAHDGIEALEIAERYRPDVILLDIGLPKMNGYDACRRIRSESWGQSIVLIALTGWGQDDDRNRSREAGFDHHMVKPADYNVLMKLIGQKTADAVR